MNVFTQHFNTTHAGNNVINVAYTSDRLSLADLVILVGAFRQQGGIFAGQSEDNTRAAIVMYAIKEAQAYGNDKSVYGQITVTCGNTTVTSLIFRSAASTALQRFTTYRLIRTFATEIFNYFVSNRVYPHNYLKHGFRYTERFIAFPGADGIDEDHATRCLTQEEAFAIQTNKYVKITTSHTSSVTIVSNLPEVHGGRVQGGGRRPLLLPPSTSTQ